MPTVTATIERILKEKDRGILKGADAMRGILKELHKQVLGELGRAALGSWDAYHLRQVLDAIEYQMANYAGQAKTEMSGLLDESWDYGKSLVDAPLALGGVYTGFWLSSAVLETLKNYSNDYLQSLFQDAWYKVKGEITLGIVGVKTPQEVTSAIGETISSGRFKNIALRAETITKHEMGTVFSEATQLRMDQAAEHVPDLEKQWRHVGHPKAPRPSHLAADGQHVPVDKPFILGDGTEIMFPRDPHADLTETMNCG